MLDQIENLCKSLVDELGLGAPADITDVVPLTGGVASDIARFDLDGRRYCAKFALPKLKVAADWHAPVHRNAAEYAWLEFASAVNPGGAVALHGRSDELHGFAMDFIDGDDVYLWKDALLNGAKPQDEVTKVGDLLGRLQAASALDGFDDRAFCNRDDFRALRIEPYLLFTAAQHPDIGGDLGALADMLYQADQVLVHGDVSPKNIIFRATGPVFLDAECATMGDSSFDPAFCLNHLILKAVHLPALRAALLQGVLSFRDAYLPHIKSEDPAALETRIARLIPALMLARVDGKSPVEYLSEDNRRHVRAIALDLIQSPEKSLAALVSRLHNALA